MNDSPHSEPLPADAQVLRVTAKGLVVAASRSYPNGTVVEFDLVMGARPLAVLTRVVGAEVDPAGGPARLELDFVAMAQVDRDSLADFLQAVGPTTLRIRPHRED